MIQQGEGGCIHLIFCGRISWDSPGFIVSPIILFPQLFSGSSPCVFILHCGLQFTSPGRGLFTPRIVSNLPILMHRFMFIPLHYFPVAESYTWSIYEFLWTVASCQYGGTAQHYNTRMVNGEQIQINQKTYRKNCQLVEIFLWFVERQNWRPNAHAN